MSTPIGWVQQRGLRKRWGRQPNRAKRTNTFLSCETLEPRNLLAGLPVITEFMASNSETLTDGNGNSSDWIEMFNAGDAATDLGGWHLTDDPADLTKWTFPAETLQPGDFLVVFASGDDTPDLAGNLHTNFRLNADGEYLALVSPDGTTIVSEFSTGGAEYPDQATDVSYGSGQAAIETILISDSTDIDVHVPASDVLGSSWKELGFVPDADWQRGRAPVGFDVLGGGGETEDGEVILEIDFNARSSASNTQDGFDVFTINGSDAQMDPVTRSFGDLDVTISDSSGAGYNDRWYFLPFNVADFDQSRLLQDSVYSLDNSGAGGLDVTVAGLIPGRTYTTTVWSFDASANGNRVSDWTVNGAVVAADYTFDGSLPTSNDTYQFQGVTTANAQGELQIQGRRDTSSVSYGVYLSGLQIIQGEVDQEPPPDVQTPVTPVLRLDMNDRSDGEAGAANTEDGYGSFNLDTNGDTYGDITVTMTAFGGGTLDDRDRDQPTDGGDFDLDQLYDDFIFVNGTTNGVGVDIHIEGLQPDTEYQVTLRSYDVSSTGTRSSIWSEESGPDSVVFADPYLFNGSISPNDNSDNTIVAMLTSSAQGELLLRGERFGGTSHGVFINALELGLPGFGSLIQTDLQSQMFQQATSVYVRVPFDVPADAEINLLSLEIAYDAGFVAYLNGTEVARRNVPGIGPPAFDVVADAERSDLTTIVPTATNLTSAANLLNVGPNVLAIHAVNSDAADDDLFLSAGLSFSTIESGAILFFDEPTPGAPNVGGFSGFVDDTQFSRQRGFYDEPFSLEITSNTPDSQIYFTTDGSVPSAANGTLYVSPITVSQTTMLRAVATKSGYRPSNVDAQTYLFLEDVLTQDPQSDPDAPNYPNTWEGGVDGDYSIDPEVVSQWDDNNPDNDDIGIREALASIPTMSIVMDHDDLWGSNGLYPDATRRIRRPGSVEYFNPNTGDQFQYNVGVQMHGNASRFNGRLLKHSFRIIFSREYDGPSRLDFPIFEGSDFADINTLVLRASFTDAFGTRTQTNRYSPLDSTYTRDVWARETQIAMGSLSADSTYVHLYINGLYWGMYNPSERADAAFYAAHEGGEPEDWDVLKDFDELDSGNRNAWNEMFALASQLPTAPDPDAIYWELQGKNPDGTDNPDLPNYLDVENLIDYMLVHFATGPEDWPSHNWHAGRNRVEPGKGFQFQVWDQEIILDGRFRDTTDASDNGNRGPMELHEQLRNSPEYLRHFGDRVQLHMFNDGALTVEANQARWMAIADHVEAAIIGESARWGDAREGQSINVPPQAIVPTITVDHWRETIADVRDRQFPQYHELTQEWLREDDLFPSVNTPEFNQFGGQVPTGFEVTMTAPPSVSREETVLLTQGDDVLAFVPSDDSLETGVGPYWYEPDFVPSGWTVGTSGVGFERDSSNFEGLIGTDMIADWNAHESSVLGRMEFDLDDDFESSQVVDLNLRMKYDDGFVVYLNGQMVTSNLAPLPSTWDSNATDDRISFLSRIFFSFNITEHSSLLQPGRNVLAFQGLNRSDTDGDLLVLPQLELTRDVPLGSPPIYFTTNGEDPRHLGGALNAAAEMFTGPLVIDETTQVQARSFIDGRWSALTSTTFVVTPPGGGVVITELNYNPYQPTAAEQVAISDADNDDFEFIEVMNTNTSEPVNLLGMRFADGVEFSFGDVTLNPSQRGVIVRDEAAFVERYGNDVNILGTYAGGLANGGERIEFVDATGNRIVEMEYTDGGLWPERADGVGATLELIDPHAITTPRAGKHYAWRGSTEFGGTPATAGAGPIGVVINEVLAHSDPLAAVDAVEFLNTSSEPVDIGGWWLSDSRQALDKFVVPAGTVLAPGEYVTFDESDFNPTPNSPAANHFAFDSGGDDVWLVIPGVNGPSSFVDDVHFGASSDGVTFGQSDHGFLPQSYATIGCENLHPQLGRVVISEVNYNPGEPSVAAQGIYQALSEDDLEFIELFNPSASTVDLSDWRLRGGVDYTILGETLLPGESVLVISFNPDDPNNVDRTEAFRAHYGLVGSPLRILGGWNGQLSDSGEEVRLRRPEITPEGTLYVYEDGIRYDDRSPWPITADGTGASLQRAAVFTGNASTSWAAGNPTPDNVALGANVANGDLTGDGNVDRHDIDVLADAVTRGIASFLDLDGSGTVDGADTNHLVTNVIGTILGDANLDGFVDGSDFNIWNDNKFSTCGKSWSHGDLNGDQTVDASDFNIWSANRFTAAMAPRIAPRVPRQAIGAAAIVPENARTMSTVDAVHADRQDESGRFEFGTGRRGDHRSTLRRSMGQAREPVATDAPADIEISVIDRLLSRWEQ